jgi:hypothetical protein
MMPIQIQRTVSERKFQSNIGDNFPRSQVYLSYLGSVSDESTNIALRYIQRRVLFLSLIPLGLLFAITVTLASTYERRLVAPGRLELFARVERIAAVSARTRAGAAVRSSAIRCRARRDNIFSPRGVR